MTTQYSIVDAHVHTFPSADIGRQATSGSGHTDFGGTPDELIGIMDANNIRTAVMVNMTPVIDMFEAARTKAGIVASPAGSPLAAPEQELMDRMLERLRRRNEWTCAISQSNPRLVAYVGLDPQMPDLALEIERRKAQGARGIKLHPSAQHFYPNDERLRDAYALAEDLGWPIIFHSGGFLLNPGVDFAEPRHFESLLAEFPKLKIVLAHLAYGDFASCEKLARAYDNVFFDCSLAINGSDPEAQIDPADTVASVRQIGVERIMFGSDYPWFDPALDARFLENLAFSSSELEALFSGNAEQILGV